MKRSKTTIKKHLIDAGLIEYETLIVYKEDNLPFNNSFNLVDKFILSWLVVVIPAFAFYYAAFLF